MLLSTYSILNVLQFYCIPKALVLDGSLQCVQCAPYAEILQIFLLFSMISYFRFQSPALSKRHDARWCNFCRSIPLSIDYVWKSSIDKVISNPSCSYCIWNRYCQNHRSIFQNFLLFALFDTLELNRLPWSNNKIYDDADFADRFRYQLAMFGIPVLIWLSWLFHAHIAYITDGAKIIAAFCRIS